ncbi:UDP-N-acetylmuramate--L-alanine ligase [Patescibacteria group bacterium]|nr:UDP-N-acetylmuramate--L-alanine ligase [Patescibacteria group bacterium]
MSFLDKANRIYCIGLKGVGMIGLAQILKGLGKEVWGSDTTEKFITDEVLVRAGLKCHEGFSAKHLAEPIDFVMRSSAYGPEQEEVAAALKKNLPTYTYAEVLAELTKTKRGLAVTGSHGKTTISALLAHILKEAEWRPTALVGSMVKNWQGNALVGDGDWFIFEADEYQNKFHQFMPEAAILTGIDWDHPDFFPDAESYYQAFVEFLKKLPPDGWLVACYDDNNVKRAVAEAGLKPEQIITYGLKNGYWKMVRMWLEEGRWHFSLNEGQEYLGVFSFRLIGGHNVANAMAAIAAARRLGIEVDVIQRALLSFEGTARRFDIKGKLTNGLTIVDDYAHHPAAITATLKAARAFYPYKNIRVVFHPHTFSRTKALFKEFANSFKEADQVIILDIYASAREKVGSISSLDLVEETKEHHKNVVHQPTVESVVEYLSADLKRNDLLITMGAGDVWRVGEELIKKFGLITGNEF